MAEVFGFEVTVVGTTWVRVVNACSAGKAKAEYWRDVRDSYPDMPYTAIRAKKIGAPLSTDAFKDMAARRGLPDVRCGDRVVVEGGDRGTIVGHNSSLNFDVLFDDDSRYPGQTLNVHPASCRFDGAEQVG
jgi:hypothetical protein